MSQGFAADEPDAPKGAAVTVLKATKSCFSDIVEVSGILIPREETTVRPERPGLKVADVLAEAGDNVTAGQTLARLTLPEGGTVQVQAPVAGLVSDSTAVTGAVASAKGEALFSISRAAEFDLVGWCRRPDIAKLGSTSRRASGSPAPARSTARSAGSRRRSSPTASSARPSSR